MSERPGVFASTLEGEETAAVTAVRKFRSMTSFFVLIQSRRTEKTRVTQWQVRKGNAVEQVYVQVHFLIDIRDILGDQIVS